MNIVIDLVIILILLFFVWRGYRNGLILGIIGIVAVIVAFTASNFVAARYSQEFTGLLYPFVSGVVDGAVSRNTDSANNDLPEADSDYEGSESGRELYVISYDALRKIGISDNAAEKVALKMSEKVDMLRSEISKNLTNFLCEKLAFLIVFAVVFILVIIIFAAVGNLLNLAFTLPGLNLLNTVGGAVFGFLKGMLLLTFVTCLLRYLGILMPAGFIQKTVLLEWFINANLLAGIIGI